MKRKSFKNMECPIARALESVGEWWSILIIRDAFHGLTKFDDFQSSLGIASSILTRRLKHLTDHGILSKRLYSNRPQRYEYILTEKGKDFFQVLIAMFAWGNKHLTPEEVSISLADRLTGEYISPILVDSNTLKPIATDNLVLIPSQNATSKLLLRTKLIMDKPINRISTSGKST